MHGVLLLPSLKKQRELIQGPNNLNNMKDKEEMGEHVNFTRNKYVAITK